MHQTVLVAGATGVLGNRIVRYLVAEPNTTIRMLVRSGALANLTKKALLTPHLDQGAELITGDLADHDSLIQATMGVDIIISAVQGGSDVIVDGQLALLDAGKKTGVRRFIPSDFALDLFKAPFGEHKLFDLRRAADTVIAKSGLEFLHVLNGVFMDLFAAPNPMFNLKTHIVRTWGIGNEQFEATSIEDVARYTAKAALDRNLPNGKFAIAGQVISFDDVSNALSRVLGHAFERERLGSVSDLKTRISELRADDTQQRLAIMSTYQLYMLNGQTSLENLQNNRYPEIIPESVSDFLHRKLGPVSGR